jgi:hypothetical protein
MTATKMPLFTGLDALATQPVARKPVDRAQLDSLAEAHDFPSRPVAIGKPSGTVTRYRNVEDRRMQPSAGDTFRERASASGSAAVLLDEGCALGVAHLSNQTVGRLDRLRSRFRSQNLPHECLALLPRLHEALHSGLGQALVEGSECRSFLGGHVSLIDGRRRSFE